MALVAPQNYMPETQNPFLQGLQGFQMAQQMAAQRDAMAVQREEQAQKVQMKADIAAFSEKPDKTIDDYQNLMVKYPQLSKTLQRSFENMNDAQKQNKIGELTTLYGFLSNNKTEDAKSYLDTLRTAYENSGDNAAAISLKSIKDSLDMQPEGPQAALNMAELQLYNAMGKDTFERMIAQRKGGKSGKTPEQIDRELALQERGMNIREEELATRKDEFKQKFGRFQPGVEKRYNDISDSLSETQRNIGQYESLAVDMENLAASGTKGGVIQSIGEYIKGVVGSTDETTLLLAKARGIRASSAMKNLPPGAASDTDVKLALSGSPPQNASPQTYASWLRGITKMMKIDAAYKDEQLKYLENSEDGSIRGFNAYWQENKEQIIKNAIGEPITSPTTKGKVSQSEFQKNLNQAGAALQNKAENLSQKSSAELFNMFQKTMRQ